MKTVTCHVCGKAFERYRMNATRAAKPQLCSKECRSSHRTARTRPTAERFWSKVDMRGPTECWEWTGHRRPNGYGWFSENNRPTNAHRVAYKLAVGSIPKGLFVCHTCDNPPCCNPNHLWLGTPAENTRDMVEKGRKVTNVALGERHHMAKLTDEQVVQIRALVASGEFQKDVARRFGVTQSNISRIARGETRAA